MGTYFTLKHYMTGNYSVGMASRHDVCPQLKIARSQLNTSDI